MWTSWISLWTNGGWHLCNTGCRWQDEAPNWWVLAQVIHQGSSLQSSDSCNGLFLKKAYDILLCHYVISRRQHFRCHFWVQFEHPRLNSKDGTQDLESLFEPPSAYHNLDIYKLPIFHVSSYFCRNLQSFLYLPGWFIPEILDPSRAWLGKKKLTGTTIHGNQRGPPLPRKGWWWLIVPYSPLIRSYCLGVLGGIRGMGPVDSHEPWQVASNSLASPPRIWCYERANPSPSPELQGKKLSFGCWARLEIGQS